MFNEIYQEKEFYHYAEPILRNSEFQRRKNFLHHNDSVYEHSLHVAWVSYKMAKFIGKYKKINIKNVIVGALLHDFYLKPWRDNKDHEWWQMHGFTHGKTAALNAYQFFPMLMNPRIENSIHRHMFPLTVIPPRYIEGWIITLADKYVSLDVFKHPKSLPRYIGIHFDKEKKCRKEYEKKDKHVSRKKKSGDL